MFSTIRICLFSPTLIRGFEGSHEHLIHPSTPRSLKIQRKREKKKKGSSKETCSGTTSANRFLITMRVFLSKLKQLLHPEVSFLRGSFLIASTTFAPREISTRSLFTFNLRYIQNLQFLLKSPDNSHQTSHKFS